MKKNSNIVTLTTLNTIVGRRFFFFVSKYVETVHLFDSVS